MAINKSVGGLAGNRWPVIVIMRVWGLGQVSHKAIAISSNECQYMSVFLGNKKCHIRRYLLDRERVSNMGRARPCFCPLLPCVVVAKDGAVAS